MRTFPFLLLAMLPLLPSFLFSQHISDFTSLEPGNQDSDFHLPSTHTFQYLIETGEPLTAGGTLPDRCDFTGYVPINGSSKQGYLSINSEDVPGGVTILDIEFDSSLQSWNISASEAVDFSLVYGTQKNCSGTVTPWGTVISCEESLPGATAASGFKSFGWPIEIDPATRSVIDQTGDLAGADKLWHMGNFKHENVVIAPNHRTAYGGEDNMPGYLYRYVANTSGDLSMGALYVLKLNTATDGVWLLLNNTTPAECNSTKVQATNAGATPFNAIEDVEISPKDGKIYFSVKGDGKVYRFTDVDPLSGTTITDFETYVGGMSYPITSLTGTVNHPWGNGNDNLAFDDKGNLWVCQDGGKNYIWVVEDGHTQAVPKVKIFGKTPNGAEPTGITFSPDYKYLFMSVMHPDAANSATTVLDAFSIPRTFDEDVVLVISLLENLGPYGFGPLNIHSQNIWAKRENNYVDIGWSAENLETAQWYVIERKSEHTDWREIFRTAPNVSANSTSNYKTKDLSPQPGSNYYRVKEVEKSGAERFSSVVEVFIEPRQIQLFPNPAQSSIYIEPLGMLDKETTVEMIDVSGKQVLSQNMYQKTQIDVEHLPPGLYLIIIKSNKIIYQDKWVIR
ncbi:MAG: DUF839 domain-containing protein [Bacteroidetes bacterium]|nr:DUF839 domain-containing protein [Bacteroidota bacterium]